MHHHAISQNHIILNSILVSTLFIHILFVIQIFFLLENCTGFHLVNEFRSNVIMNPVLIFSLHIYMYIHLVKNRF